MPPVPPPSRPHHASQPLTGPEDALSVVYAALSDPPRPESLLLVLDHAHRGLGCIVVTGRPSARSMADFAVELALQEAAVCAFVVATVRPGGGYLPTPHDESAFAELRCRLDALGVDLLDWFVLSGCHAGSLAELTDSQLRWRTP